MKKSIDLSWQELAAITGGAKKSTHFDLKKMLHGFFGGKGLI